MECKFKVNRAVLKPKSKDNLVGFECIALDDCDIYHTPNATYELGLAKGAYKENVTKDTIFILSTVEFFLNLSFYDFKCKGVSVDDNDIDIELAFPSLEEKTTIIPYYRLRLVEELKTTEPFVIDDDTVFWTEPVDVYKKAFQEIYSERISNNSMITRCENCDEKTVQTALLLALMNIMKNDINQVKQSAKGNSAVR